MTSLCDDCQHMYDKWLHHVWPQPHGWIHLGSKQLSAMNYQNQQQDRSKLVRHQLDMIRNGCTGHNKTEYDDE